MEQNVAQRFSKAFNDRFPWIVKAADYPGYANTSLGSQDRSFADHLIAAEARFAIIEFKAFFSDISSEADKPLRQKLFEALTLRGDMLRRCLDFHYICWGAIESSLRSDVPFSIEKEVELINHYALHVAPFMKNRPPVRPTDDLSIKNFLDGFLGTKLIGGNGFRFETYINELAKLAGGKDGDASTIEGMVFVYWPEAADGQGVYESIRFKGLEDLAMKLEFRVPALERTKSYGAKEMNRSDSSLDHGSGR